MQKAIKFLLIIWAVLFAAVGIFGLLVWKKVLIPNVLLASRYPVTGVDVSSYQGKVDWQILAGEGISFAYIKATEGSSFVDPCFAENYEQAQQTGLRVGAYHFFSFDSGGKTQAENFIAVVPSFEGMLPPVVDIEFYGEYEKNPPDREPVREQLDILLLELEAQYGIKPVLYATQKSYQQYLAGDFTDYDIWIRNVYTPPLLSDGRNWIFWQYTDQGKLSGYDGEEQSIDRNVFSGSAEEFAEYP